jgi:hypothetical protein
MLYLRRYRGNRHRTLSAEYLFPWVLMARGLMDYRTTGFSLPFGGGVGPASLSVTEDDPSPCLRTLRPRTGPPMPTPGEGRAGVICVGFLVSVGSGFSRFPLVGGDRPLLLGFEDVGSRALVGTASAVLARSTPTEDGVSTTVSALFQTKISDNETRNRHTGSRSNSWQAGAPSDSDFRLIEVNTRG